MRSTANRWLIQRRRALSPRLQRGFVSQQSGLQRRHVDVPRKRALSKRYLVRRVRVDETGLLADVLPPAHDKRQQTWMMRNTAQGTTESVESDGAYQSSDDNAPNSDSDSYYTDSEDLREFESQSDDDGVAAPRAPYRTAQPPPCGDDSASQSSADPLTEQSNTNEVFFAVRPKLQPALREAAVQFVRDRAAMTARGEWLPNHISLVDASSSIALIEGTVETHLYALFVLKALNRCQR